MSRIVVAILLVGTLLLSVNATLAATSTSTCHDHPASTPKGDGVRTVIDPTTCIPVPEFKDGRLNAADLAAPVVVYYDYTEKPVLNPNGQQAWGTHGDLLFQKVVTGIDVVPINLQNGLIESAFHVTTTQLDKAIQAGKNMVLATDGGISLNYSDTGWFWVSAPDKGGKTYSFQWQDSALLPLPTSS